MNISAEAGDMGILANHVPSIEALRPGVVEVIESAGGSKKWFGERKRDHTTLCYVSQSLSLQFRAALLPYIPITN